MIHIGKKNSLDITVVEEGNAFSNGLTKVEIALNIAMLYVFQFFPIIVFAIIDWFTAASYYMADYAENLLVICIVSNATGVFNNTKRNKASNSIMEKIFAFARSLVMALGSIVYSILLINRISTENLQIVTNILGIMIFAVACFVITVAISYLSMLKGGEI